MIRHWRDRLSEPTDVAALVVFRVLFGLVGTFGALRFLYYGWVDRCFALPQFFFHYYGLSWVLPLSPFGMHAVFAALACLGVAVACGFFYRVTMPLFALLFAYVELIDVSNYLNHYYLVICLATWMSFMPLERAHSFDSWRNPSLRVETFPRWMTWAIRFQVGVVYFYASLAKFHSDWLIHAQPLSLWLAARTDTPILGPLFGYHTTALAMSWGGFLYDLAIPFLLSHRRTRLPAFAVALVFHALTRVLLNIGLFPLIMTTTALIFFPPDWPRSVFRLGKSTASTPEQQAFAPRPQAIATTFLCLFSVFQALFPLRYALYGGNVLWHEQGMRWSWRVVVREKNGAVTFRVVSDQAVHPQEEDGLRILTRLQQREMETQPDLILQFAHELAHRHRMRGETNVRVYADAWASLNGRTMQRMIDPEVDLASVQDGFAAAEWILPSPQ